MLKGLIAGAFTALAVVVALRFGLASDDAARTAVPVAGGVAVTTPVPQVPASPALLYGRVTMDDGTVYEGRLRWGGDEEALWHHAFNGRRAGNPWLAHVPSGEGPTTRPFMARLGELARIDARGRDFRVTLRSGTVVDLARFEADDLADGLRVWDPARGVVDLNEWRIRSVEFLPAPPGAPTAARADADAEGPTDARVALHGTVYSGGGVFTGLVQWDRQQGLLTDELAGRSAEGDVRLRFSGIRSIARASDESVVVTLDGRTVELSGTRATGEGNRGVYVDDARYGRVLVPWTAFQRVDFTTGEPAPGYGDYEPGRPLTGTVVTRAGERRSGRLVYDLDESETTETLDAPRDGLDYLIPFTRIAALDVPADPEQAARVTLRDGEVLELDRAGDLGPTNAGMLVFVAGREQAEFVPWAEVARVEFGG